MTPKEITYRLMELNCIFQAQPKHAPQGMSGLLNMLTGLNHGPANEDYNQMGYNKEDENADANVEEINEPDLTLEVITAPKELIKHEAWFLGQAPPKEFPARIAGQIMSIGIHERCLFIRLEEIPWGLQAGEIRIACEYITSLDTKNGSLLIFSKVGNVALQIHEITENQCIK